MQGVKRFLTRLLTLSNKPTEREALELCGRIRNETGKAGIAIAAHLRMGFFISLSVSI